MIEVIVKKNNYGDNNLLSYIGPAINIGSFNYIIIDKELFQLNGKFFRKDISQKYIKQEEIEEIIKSHYPKEVRGKVIFNYLIEIENK